MHQQEFADRLGVSVRTIQSYEQGINAVTQAMEKLIRYTFPGSGQKVRQPKEEIRIVL